MDKKIKRYKIISDTMPGQFRVVDRLRDDFVCVPLISDSEEKLLSIMGKDMDELMTVWYRDDTE